MGGGLFPASLLGERARCFNLFLAAPQLMFNQWYFISKIVLTYNGQVSAVNT
jgi:hypothetical protein